MIDLSQNGQNGIVTQDMMPPPGAVPPGAQMITDPNIIAQIMNMMLMQFGVKEERRDEDKIYFTVPSMSDLTAERNMPAMLDDMGGGPEPLAGDLLLALASSYYQQQGWEPHGTVRSEYWTQTMANYTMEQSFAVPGAAGITLGGPQA